MNDKDNNKSVDTKKENTSKTNTAKNTSKKKTVAVAETKTAVNAECRHCVSYRKRLNDGPKCSNRKSDKFNTHVARKTSCEHFKNK